MPTLKDISLRLKSIKNIQKITQSMKMVSAAKYARAERDLKGARSYGVGAQAFYDNVEIEADETKPKQLLIAVSSDRGLCGAIHSNIFRTIRSDMEARARTGASPSEVKIVCVGDKSRSLISRSFSQNVLFHATEIGRTSPTFGDAALIVQQLLDDGYEFDCGKMYFNYFKSVVSYKTTAQPLFSLDAISQAEKMSLYDDVDADTLRSYQEYSLASLLYYALKEGACSEQSSRMTSMDNASKSAGEMIDNLTLTFNRTRQAVITRELIEIISGAAAL